jgi:uncharacterized membrane protein YccC
MRHRRVLQCIAAASIAALLLGTALSVEPARASLFSGAPPAFINPTSPGIRSSPPPASSSGTSLFPGDWSQLLPTLIATFLGAGLALITALWAARADERRSKARETRANIAHFRELLGLVSREIASNQSQISVALVDLKSNLLTDRAPVLDVWSSNGYEVLKTSSTVTAEIADAYTSLRRFARLLDQYRAEVNRGGTDARTARTETYPRLQALGQETQLVLEAASKRIEEELSKPT